MQRNIVQIAKMCVMDVRVGDAVGTDPDNTRGWFVVEEVVPLTSGEVALVGDRGRSTITAAKRDVVGIQVRQTVELAVEAVEQREPEVILPPQPERAPSASAPEENTPAADEAPAA